jgi:hypothetical protein
LGSLGNLGSCGFLVILGLAWRPRGCIRLLLSVFEERMAARACKRSSQGPARIATLRDRNNGDGSHHGAWACTRLAERLYGPRGTHGSAIAFLEGPQGSQRRSHHGDVSALPSAFTAPEERMGAQSLSGRARENRGGDRTMGMYPRLAERLYGPRGTHGSAIAFLKGPRGSQRRSRHGHVATSLSAFTATEERMGAQSLSGRAREDRSGDRTMGMCPLC